MAGQGADCRSGAGHPGGHRQHRLCGYRAQDRGEVHRVQHPGPDRVKDPKADVIACQRLTAK
jgi:hypothetical protein